MADTPKGATQVAKAELGVSDVLRRSYKILTQGFSAFVAIAAVASLPYLLIYFQFAGETPEEIRSHLSDLIIPLLLSIVLSGIMQAAFLFAVLQVMSGRPPAIRDSLQRAIERLPAVIGLSICVTIAAIVGFVLLIVPCFIVLTMFFVGMPACLAEGLDPIASLKRSAALTKGYRWKIFGIAVLIGLVITIGGGILGAVAGLGGFAARAVVDFAWRTVFGAFYAIVVVVIYRDLRAIKEGVTAERLASALD